MKIAEIVAVDAQRHGKMPGAVLTGLSIAVDRRKARILQDNKTIFVLDPIDGADHEFEAHMLTADNAAGFRASTQVLFDKVRNMPGVQKVYAKFKNEKLVSLAKAVGADIKKSDKEGFTWMTEF